MCPEAAHTAHDTSRRGGDAVPRCRTARPIAALLGGCAVLAACGTDGRGPAPQPAPAAAAVPHSDARCSPPRAQRLGGAEPPRPADIGHGLPTGWHPYGPE